MSSVSRKKAADLNATTNLVHPQWETIDPTPDIKSLFTKFNEKFFAGRLLCVELEWSSSMYSCAGICYWTQNRLGKSCVIRLSEPLLKLRPRKDLVQTLLHEMIHAWNFIHGIKEENGGHGQYFLTKMHEINRLAGTKISVYHNFHDEVDLYKKHWWRCSGVCKKLKPYYGFVKRAENKTPGPRDKWWNEHEFVCGGVFTKVKGPEIDGKKKDKKSSSSIPSQKTVKALKVVLETPKIPVETKKKEVLDENGNIATGFVDNELIVIDEVLPPPRPNKSIHSIIRTELDDENIIFIDDEFDDNFIDLTGSDDEEKQPKEASCHCPVCNVKLKVEEVNAHLDQCLVV